VVDQTWLLVCAGTLVTRIKEATLTPGCTLRIGEVNLRVVSRSSLVAMFAGDEQKPTAAVSSITGDGEDSAFGGLSSSQLQVLRLLLQGFPEKKVAAWLDLSRHTVHTHVKHIYQQLRVRSRAELLALYIAKPAIES
jgi:DNA-binding NarL/FixJ family response regulator